MVRLDKNDSFCCQQKILGRDHMQQVGQQALMKGTGVAARADDTLTVQQQKGAVLGSLHTDRQRRHTGAGKSLPKKLRRLERRDNAAVAIVVFLNDMDSAGQHQTDPACRVSGTENHLVLFDLHVAGSQTGEHLG